jgi:hypothetical protein
MFEQGEQKAVSQIAIARQQRDLASRKRLKTRHSFCVLFPRFRAKQGNQVCSDWLYHVSKKPKPFL